ncbi:MAG: ROK family protein [Acidimicrobiales bacterium]
MKVLGIDIGGTGIKGAVVDTKRGVLKSDRLRILTPIRPRPTPWRTWWPASPRTSSGTARSARRSPASCATARCTPPPTSTLPGSASRPPTPSPPPPASVVTCINDADAAGEAEAAFGAAKGVGGVVLVVTLGTGIGSALLVDGRLVPNTELGHLSLHGGDAEHYAAESVRETQALSWEDWAARVNEYLHLVEDLFWPDRFVLGGGVSKQADKFIPLLDVRTPVVPAELRNKAGMVGAAEVARRTAAEGHNHDGRLRRRR